MVNFIVQISVDGGSNWQSTKLYPDEASAKTFALQIRERAKEYGIRIVAGFDKTYAVKWSLDERGQFTSPKEALISNVTDEIEITRLNPLYLYVVNLITMGAAGAYWMFKRRDIFNMMAGRSVFNITGFYLMSLGWLMAYGLVFAGVATKAIYMGGVGFIVGLAMWIAGRILVVPKLRMSIRNYSRNILGVEQTFRFLPSAFGGAAYLAHKLNGLVIAR